MAASRSFERFDSHLRILVIAGVLDEGDALRALKAFDEVRAMTWRLINPAT